jgi:DNA mismatch endonuclease (patch repair protein)
MALIKLLSQHHITGWRRHFPIFGKPDFVFRKQRVAVFVDGCFWHCCPHHSNLPVNSRAFWRAKLDGNRRRDRRVDRTLRKRGWRVLRIWEHDLSRRSEPKLLRRIMRMLAMVNSK